MQQTKDEAREETLRRWTALPAEDRLTLEQANVFAAALAEQLEFRTMGNRRRVILGWIVRDMDGLPAWGNILPESLAGTADERAAARERLRADTDGDDDLREAAE